MTEISKACLISPLAFHPPKQIDTVRGFFFFFWIAACWSFDDEMLQSVQSLMLWISQLLPLVFLLIPVLSLSSRAHFFIMVQDLTSCGYTAKWKGRKEELRAQWKEIKVTIERNGEQYASLVSSKCLPSHPHPILLPHTPTVTGS